MVAPATAPTPAAKEDEEEDGCNITLAKLGTTNDAEVEKTGKDGSRVEQGSTPIVATRGTPTPIEH